MVLYLMLAPRFRQVVLAKPSVANHRFGHLERRGTAAELVVFCMITPITDTTGKVRADAGGASVHTRVDDRADGGHTNSCFFAVTRFETMKFLDDTADGRGRSSSHDLSASSGSSSYG